MTSHPTVSGRKISYPYKVDYNDHFETPLVAYTDILPLLDAVAPRCEEFRSSKKKKRCRQKKNKDDETCQSSSAGIGTNTDTGTGTNNRCSHIIYDPYYCNGRTKQLFNSLGFTNVQHEKRDFYKDIKHNTLPDFNTLVTNPPYSQDHKEKCMLFAIKRLRETTNPFFILMPNYVACRNHFRTAISIKNLSQTKSKQQKEHGGNDPLDIMYVVPSTPYEYEHPEGTGKEIPPFASIWFCGIPVNKVESVKEAFRNTYGEDSIGVPPMGRNRTNSSTPRLVSSLSELKKLNAVPTVKRLNPRQRKKARMAKSKGSVLNINGSTPNERNKPNPPNTNKSQNVNRKRIKADQNEFKEKKKKKRRF